MTTPGGTRRLASVDVLRGLTMAAMIVVNNPGSWSAMYPWLRHAGWGETLRPADLIFPMFLFLVGVSTALAIDRRRAEGRAIRSATLRRAAGLLLIGVGLNLYPDFDLATLRLPGVLQRIALVYLACAFICLHWGWRGRGAIAAGLLAGYAALLAWVPVPGEGRPLLTPETSLPVWLDDRLLGAHSWRGPGDPEGLLSTLPAIASGLVGLLVGGYLVRRPVGRDAMIRLGCAGLLSLAVGWAWSLGLPAIKELWTPPYVLLTAGWALLALVACMWGFDGPAGIRWAGPVAVLGRRALTAFVAAHLLSDTAIRVLRRPHGDGTLSLHHFISSRLLESGLSPEAASLVQSLSMLGLIWVALVLIETRRRRS